MHFLFFNILDRPQKNDLNLFLTLVPGAEKKAMSSGRKPHEGSVKGLIEIEVGKNSRDIMHMICSYKYLLCHFTCVCRWT